MMELTLICRLITLALLCLGMFGCTGSDQDGRSKTSVLSESASYSSQERQSELKAALAVAKVEYQAEMRSGQEFVTWGAKDSVIAKAALGSPLGPELPAGRHMSFSNELGAEFEDWLKANGVSYFTKSRDGQAYVVWSEQDDSRVRDWLRKRLPEAVYVTMFDRPAPGTSAGK
jgi:hypothetical protein